jgi:integrase
MCAARPIGECSRPVTSRRRSTSGRSRSLRRPLSSCVRCRSGSTRRSCFRPRRGGLWWERNFYRDVWYPAQEAWAGIDPALERAERRRLAAERGRDFAPHDFRHSWVTHLRAAGIDPADLAAVAGHTVETATARYTHALGRSDDRIRQVIG